MLLAYPNFNKRFMIHTDASHKQLDAVILPDNRPIAIYPRKLNPAQTRAINNHRKCVVLNCRNVKRVSQLIYLVNEYKYILTINIYYM
jgi:hypothetical protein